MTPDHSALIERLEGAVPHCASITHKDLLAEAAAALRDQQAAIEKWKRLKGYADDQIRIERQTYRSLLADHEGLPLPSAPDQAKALK